MEAMASGVPVVATRVAGVGELVEDGVSGFLVPPGDPAPLAESVAKLIEDPALRSRFGAAGRAKVEKEFDVRHEAARLHGILVAALRGNGAEDSSGRNYTGMARL
jgi:glycosyltransferase involved in cell wall biosynthesis